MISNPVQRKEPAAIEMQRMERDDTRDEILPMVKRNHDRQLYYPYAAQHKGYYYVNPYYYNRYNTYMVYDVYDSSRISSGTKVASVTSAKLSGILAASLNSLNKLLRAVSNAS